MTQILNLQSGTFKFIHVPYHETLATVQALNQGSVPDVPFESASKLSYFKCHLNYLNVVKVKYSVQQQAHSMGSLGVLIHEVRRVNHDGPGVENFHLLYDVSTQLGLPQVETSYNFSTPGPSWFTLQTS